MKHKQKNYREKTFASPKKIRDRKKEKQLQRFSRYTQM